MENAIIIASSVLAAAVIMVAACIGATKGDAAVAVKALESMARQPEQSGKIQTAMIIAAALIEGAGLFGIVVALLGNG